MATRKSEVTKILKAVENKVEKLGPEAAPVVKALGVFLLDENLRRFLRTADPKAHDQALRALGVIG